MICYKCEKEIKPDEPFIPSENGLCKHLTCNKRMLPREVKRFKGIEALYKSKKPSKIIIPNKRKF
jgi:hypothetical protein